MKRRAEHARATARQRVAVTAATAVVAGLAGAAGVGQVPAQAEHLVPTVDPTQATGSGTYLVTLEAPPAALHKATRPDPDERFDRTSPEVRDYVAQLRAAQEQVLRKIGEPKTLYHYTTAVNGFAAELDQKQVKELREVSRVSLVERSTTLDTAQDSGEFLGLAGSGGAWARHGGPADAGRGVVIGVIDSGIWPENPSFAGLPQDQPGTSSALPGFHGACQEAEEWSPDDCNDKIVSARWFVRAFGKEQISSSEVLSARDTTGHGSHAASTAAGERNIRAEIDGQDFGRKSGMAPAARLAVYKACWTAPDPEDDGCAAADAVAAIDQAVADGVDVLSYSLTGSSNPTDTVARAFMAASAAGVFVAAAAGNTGPAAGSVGNAAPWVTTVGASTHRVYLGAVRLGDGTSYVGAMTSERSVQEAPLLLAEDAAVDESSADTARRCEIGSLDASVVQDTVVVCDRGIIPRVEKSAAVARAGGVGMVLANTTADSLDADVHSVPTVHIDAADAAAVKAYVRQAGADATVTLDPSGTEDVEIPTIAPFSARGPVPGGNLLKPDLTAPGVGVIGAVAPPASSGRLWDLASGTSVSVPHVAGLAAFVQSVHPDWAPSRVKSAMMTTAYPLEGVAGPFAQGAGHVDPTQFLDPGLVLDTTPRQWADFLAGEVPATELNLPSIAVGDMVGATTVTRTVTNVGDTTETYTANWSGLDGIDVQVRPTTVSLNPGESREIRIRLSASPAASVGEYAKGLLTWTGLSHQVRLPVVVRTMAVAVPGAIGGSGESGQLVVSGRSGTGDPLELTSTGLVPTHPVGLTLSPGQFDATTPEADNDTFATDVTVPEGTEAARFELDSHNLEDDVDIYVYREDQLVESATRPSGDATVTLLDPAPGTYEVYVNAVSAANDAVVTSKLSSWVVGQDGGAEVDLDMASAATAPGDEFEYTASWDELDPTQSWFGVVRYGNGERRTLVRIN